MSKVELRKAIGRRIKEVRKVLDLTQVELAETVGETRAILSQVEIGKSSPNSVILNKMCTEYNVCMNWVFTGEGDMLRNQDEAETTLKDLYPEIRNIKEYEHLLDIASNLGMDKMYMAIIKEWESLYGARMLESFGLKPISKIMETETEQEKKSS